MHFDIDYSRIYDTIDSGGLRLQKELASISGFRASTKEQEDFTMAFGMKNILQGATGTKMSITSIDLFSIIDVRMVTSGFGFDDSELTFTYINSPELKGHHVTYASHKLEFPKKYNVQSLYKILQELAYDNCLKMNGLS